MGSHSLHIVVLQILKETFEAGTIIPFLQETEAQWDEVTRPVSRQLGRPLRIVLSLASWCLSGRPLSVL